jgi:15,16-dihydrobiliverdin:ferredoxin oxidoreductase
MDKLKNKIISHLESRYTLDPLPVPDDLKEIKRFLGVFKLNMYNWKMEKVRKISVMRCSVRVPGLEIFAIEIYPEADYDLPLLAIDFSCMKKKSFVYMNFIPLFTDRSYHDKYILPLKEVYERYDIVPKKQAKEWMVPYLTDYSVYAMPENSLLEKACECAGDYLSFYLEMLDSSEKITDPLYKQKVETASLNYCDQLSEKDGSRKMLGRFTGMDRANRIFREVIR